MSTLKEIMVKGMNKVMLDCDEATMLATKQSAENINCLKKTQLRMHLMGCKFCKAFVQQTKLMDEQLYEETHLNRNELKLHLSVNQKERLQSTIENNIE